MSDIEKIRQKSKSLLAGLQKKLGKTLGKKEMRTKS